MTRLPMLSAEETLKEIRRLYFATTKKTVREDLAKALDLLKSMTSEEERERATVYMHGLNEMNREWSKTQKRRGARKQEPSDRFAYRRVVRRGVDIFAVFNHEPERKNRFSAKVVWTMNVISRQDNR